MQILIRVCLFDTYCNIYFRFVVMDPDVLVMTFSSHNFRQLSADQNSGSIKYSMFSVVSSALIKTILNVFDLGGISIYRVNIRVSWN